MHEVETLLASVNDVLEGRRFPGHDIEVVELKTSAGARSLTVSADVAIRPPTELWRLTLEYKQSEGSWVDDPVGPGHLKEAAYMIATHIEEWRYAGDTEVRAARLR